MRRNPPDSDHEETCIETDPMPEGFVFVPKGDPYITRNCKSRSKDAGSTVYIVYDKKERTQLGIRVSTSIYNTVTASAKQTASQRAAAVESRDARTQHKAALILHKTFPNIPAPEANEILAHAFLKGSGRVGRTATRPDDVKATLAVEAFIRHQHTPYEQLLRDGVRREAARDAVWELVQRVRDSWAGKAVG